MKVKQYIFTNAVICYNYCNVMWYYQNKICLDSLTTVECYRTVEMIYVSPVMYKGRIFGINKTKKIQF